jgi:hypothetical protein
MFIAGAPSIPMEPVHQDVCQGSELWSPIGVKYALQWLDGVTVILEPMIPPYPPENAET